MKKKGRRKRYVLAAIVLLAVGWIFRPYESADQNNLIPELQDLKDPLFVKTRYWEGDGSLGILIKDDEGKTSIFCIPHSMDSGEDYQRLFSGASHFKKEGAVEVEDAHHSKVKLLEILRDAPRKDMDRDRVIASVSGRWRDWAVFYYRRFKDEEYYDW